MGDREQQVWASVFASQTSTTEVAARKADEVVKSLKEFNIDRRPSLELWEVAALAGFLLKRRILTFGIASPPCLAKRLVPEAIKSRLRKNATWPMKNMIEDGATITRWKSSGGWL